MKSRCFRPAAKQNKLLAHAVSSSAATGLRNGDVRGASASRRRGRRTVPGPLDAHRAQQPHRRPDHVADGKIFPGRPASARGSATPWARRIRTCPPTSCCATRRVTTPAARCCGTTAGCRRLYRGTEFSTHGHAGPESAAGARPPPASQRRPTWTSWPRSTRHHRQPIRARRSWKRGSRTTSWRPACSWPPATSSTCRKESDATGSCTVSTTPRRPATGMRCLMARRLIESGVRFVQVFVSPPLIGSLASRDAAWTR